MANPGTIRVKFSKVSASPASLFSDTWQQFTVGREPRRGDVVCL